MSRVSAVAACFTALGVVVATLEPASPAPRAESAIGKANFGSVPDPGPRGQKADFGSVPDPGPRGQKADFWSVPDPGPRGPAPDFGMAEDEATVKPDPTMPSRPRGRDTADIATELLTIDAAKRAIDGFVAVRDKYNNDGIENYNSLEAFVAETEAGKRLEAEIMAHGFSDITDWNMTIMAVGFAYSAIVYDYATDLRQQINAVRNDRSLDEEMRTRLIAGLNALMPSRHNRTVLQTLLDDPIYRDKLKLLQEEE
jgi:hypothetical protein